MAGEGAGAFSPMQLGRVELRNRVIKAATFEGMSPGGLPAPGLIEHHRGIAAGGAAMTTVAYCAVSDAGRTFDGQLYAHDAALSPLRTLTDAVHAEGAAASLQLTHCGFFTRHRHREGRPAGPSAGWNAYGVAVGLPRARAMTAEDIEKVTADFVRASRWACRAGFDAVELHLGHGYLLSQFISPATNRRRDGWGGPLERRLRFPLDVVRRVRDALPDGVAVLAKTNLSDGFRGGLTIDESVEAARRLARAGVDGLVLSGGFTSRAPFYTLRGDRPLSGMVEVEHNPLQRVSLRVFGPWIVREYPFEELFFLPEAREVRRAVDVPLVLLGGVVSIDNLEQAMSEGFDLVAMGRALIADPTLPRDMEAGRARRSRCVHCNECVVEMDRGGVRCVLGPSEDCSR